jgi:hypothetical protein
MSGVETYIPELEDTLWRINGLIWDRTAIELGKYRFTLDLGYIWRIPGESQLYDVSIGSVNTENAKFEVFLKGSNSSIFPSNFKLIRSAYQINKLSFDYYSKYFNSLTSSLNYYFYFFH